MATGGSRVICGDHERGHSPDLAGKGPTDPLRGASPLPACTPYHS